MDESSGVLVASSERLAAAAEALEKLLERIETSQQELHAKVDRIIAAIETDGVSNAPSPDGEGGGTQSDRVAELERENAELKAQSARLARKTLSPLVSGLLSKSGVEESGSAIDAGVLEKALSSLSLEQRISVKAELARAGMIA